jgi:hypothetical protein
MIAVFLILESAQYQKITSPWYLQNLFSSQLAKMVDMETQLIKDHDLVYQLLLF